MSLLFVLFLSYVQLQYTIEQERYPFWVFTTLPPAKPLKTGFPYLIYTCFSFLSFLWLFKWMGSLFETEIVQPVCITDNYDHIFTKRWNGFVLLLLILCILARGRSWNLDDLAHVAALISVVHILYRGEAAMEPKVFQSKSRSTYSSPVGGTILSKLSSTLTTREEEREQSCGNSLHATGSESLIGPYLLYFSKTTSIVYRDKSLLKAEQTLKDVLGVRLWFVAAQCATLPVARGHGQAPEVGPVPVRSEWTTLQRIVLHWHHHMHRTLWWRLLLYGVSGWHGAANVWRYPVVADESGAKGIEREPGNGRFLLSLV